MTEAEVAKVLSGVDKPTSSAILALIDQHLDAWRGQAVGPGVNSEARHFFAGAAFATEQTRQVFEAMLHGNRIQ